MKMAGLRRLTDLFLLLGALLLGAGAQQTVLKAVGSEVIMKPKYTGNPSEINWKINGNRLVDMEVNSQNKPPMFYRLQDRASIDRTNGVLTIRDLRIEDSGDYRAEALVNNNYQYTDITLTVRACPDKPNITNKTTKENIVLYCESSTPGVTYKWFTQTESVGKGQSYSEPRPEHDVTLTCFVENEVCKKNSSITIPYTPPPPPPPPPPDFFHILKEMIIPVLPVLIPVLVLLVFVLILFCLRKTPCMVTFFDRVYYFLTCCKAPCMVTFFDSVYYFLTCCKGKETENDDEKKQRGKETENDDEEKQRATVQPENEQNTPLITVATVQFENEQNTPLITLDSESCGCISLNLSSKGPVKSVELLRVGVPSVEAFLGELNGQLQRIKSLVLTLDRVKTEDYAAEAHLPNGERRVFTIKGVKGEDDVEKGHVVYKKVEEEDDVVIIKTCGDRVTLTVPDVEAVTKLVWKKGDVPQFEWTTNKITLEPGSVTIKNLVPGDSGTYEVDIHSTDGSVTKNTFQLEVVKRGNAENVMLKVVRKVDPPEDGDTESQPIGSITFHPIKRTNMTGIIWKKEGSPVKYFGDRFTPGQNGYLTIKDVTVEDKGTYTVYTEDWKQQFDLCL